MGDDDFPAWKLAEGVLAPGDLRWRRRSLETVSKDGITRAREEGGLLAWDVRIADTMTVTRPL